MDWFRTFLDLTTDPVRTAQRALEEDDPAEVVKRAETLALLESDAWREVAELREEVQRLRGELSELKRLQHRLEKLEELTDRAKRLEERLERAEKRVKELEARLETKGLLQRLRQLLRRTG